MTADEEPRLLDPYEPSQHDPELDPVDDTDWSFWDALHGVGPREPEDPETLTEDHSEHLLDPYAPLARPEDDPELDTVEDPDDYEWVKQLWAQGDLSFVTDEHSAAEDGDEAQTEPES